MTDSNVILGYINPEFLVGGALNGGTANIGAGGITTTGTAGVNSILNLGGATVRSGR